MKIGIISDSHDRLPALRDAVTQLLGRRVEAIFHAGDFVAPFAAKCLTPDKLAGVPLYAIYGNNDGERAGLKKVLPQLVDGPLHVELAGKRFAMHHFLDWFAPEDLVDADVVISGHDHTLCIEPRDGKLFINPGECCGWLTGRCTCAVLETDTMSVEVIDLHA